MRRITRRDDKEYVIDGLFLTQKMTGTQRYACEITRELDNIAEGSKITILTPKSTTKFPKYKNIKIVQFGNHKGILWQQVDLARYLMENKGIGIFLNNVFPLSYKNGIIAIHDVCYKENPQFYSSIRDKLSMWWHRLNYWMAAHSDMIIVTVSDFSKSKISKYYKVESNRIKVVYSSWQHINRMAESKNVFEKWPALKEKDYYFTMSSLEINKNFQWILQVALNNPSNTFVIAGGGKLKGAAARRGFSDLKNVHFLGYISDEEAKTLMTNCKAFLFPTLYEGFGLPPLEAVACGCKQIIVSDTPCMHEIYGEYATYIDVQDCRLPKTNMYASSELLNRYSWKNSAKILYDIISGSEN